MERSIQKNGLINLLILLAVGAVSYREVFYKVREVGKL